VVAFFRGTGSPFSKVLTVFARQPVGRRIGDHGMQTIASAMEITGKHEQNAHGVSLTLRDGHPVGRGG